MKWGAQARRLLCLLAHRWLPFDRPAPVVTDQGSVVIAQRAVCARCGATKYRKVKIHG
jgi:hypothetical protein